MYKTINVSTIGISLGIRNKRLHSYYILGISPCGIEKTCVFLSYKIQNNINSYDNL